MARHILARWAQQRLGVAADGAWGPESRDAMRRWQIARGFAATGDLDAATAAMVALL